MPRRREVAKRETIPDPIFNSKLVTRCINVIMEDGMKNLAGAANRSRLIGRQLPSAEWLGANEIFVGHRTHQSARYRIGWTDVEVRHSKPVDVDVTRRVAEVGEVAEAFFRGSDVIDSGLSCRHSASSLLTR